MQRIFDVLSEKIMLHNRPNVVVAKQHGEWTEWSASLLVDQVNTLSRGLLAEGVQKNDRIGIIAEGRPEWNIIDFAVQQVGGILVPIYPTMTTEDFLYIFKESEIKLLFVEDKKLFERVAEIVPQTTIEAVYTIEEVRNANHWTDISKRAVEVETQILENRKKEVDAEDLVSIIYTSGTTGAPKGVMLSHRNILSNVLACAQVIDFGVGTRALSFLPLNHVFERTVQYVYLQSGISIYYADSVATIAQDLRDVRPRVFSTVPRLLEKTYDTIVTKGYELPKIQREIFLWALGLALNYDPNKKHSLWYNTQLGLARKLVFRKWQEALGGSLEMIVTGAAALPPRIARVFWAAGIPVCEGYGLTETSPVVAVNRLKPGPQVAIGTVGIVLEGVEVKIAEDGEILVKGPNVMQGYYQKPEVTAEVLSPEGWFHTGDIGEFVEGKFLKITDRKKEIFKTLAGKYVSPQAVEARLTESMWIEQAVVFGDGKKYAAALISPAAELVKDFCKNEGIAHDLQHPKVQKHLKQEVDAANAQLAAYQHVKKFQLLPQPLSVERGELTPTLKPKRRIIQANYKAEIEALF